MTATTLPASHETSVHTWTPAHDTALTTLLAAWRHHDDIRRDPAATLREQSQALLALERARWTMRAADTTLAA